MWATYIGNGIDYIGFKIKRPYSPFNTTNLFLFLVSKSHCESNRTCGAEKINYKIVNKLFAPNTCLLKLKL